MSLNELSAVIAAALFSAILVGWVLHWLWCMLSRAVSSDRVRMSHLVQRLDAAEHAREQAEAARAEQEVALMRRISELEVALEDQAAAYQAALQAGQAEQERAIEAARADAQAAWDGLGNARRRIAELERILSAE
ncbi:MAG: hypothetical protein ACFBRM_01020 [Pikeienuella sp.]